MNELFENPWFVLPLIFVIYVLAGSLEYPTVAG